MILLTQCIFCLFAGAQVFRRLLAENRCTDHAAGTVRRKTGRTAGALAGSAAPCRAAVDHQVICWHWRGTVFTVDFSFFAVAALVAVRGGALYFLLLFLACLLHELGHLAMLLLFHRHVQTVSLCGAGALFVPSAACGAYWQDILVSLAGPAVNLLLGTAFLWGDRGSVSGMLHLGLGLFNLLPYARLDGGAVCRSGFCLRSPVETNASGSRMA